MSRCCMSLALMIASAGFAWAQGPGSGGGGGGGCARRGGGSATVGMSGTLESSTGTSGSTTSAVTAAALLGSSGANSALASRTYLLERQLAAQQAYLQYLQQHMAQQQQAQAAADQAAQAKNERHQRLRRLNAEKALVAAKKAEMNGKSSVAARHYRRVVELASRDESLAGQAREALGRLESPQGPALVAKRP